MLPYFTGLDQHFYFRYWEDLPYRKDRGKWNRTPEQAEDSRWRRGGGLTTSRVFSWSRTVCEDRGKLSGDTQASPSATHLPAPSSGSSSLTAKGLCPTTRTGLAIFQSGRP